MMKTKQKSFLNYTRQTSIIVFVLIVILDQISKYWIRTNIFLNNSMVIIKPILSFTYVRNTGVSFGLFKGYIWIFTLILILALIYFVFLFFKEKQYRLIYSIICAGIVGNLIDRLFLGYVVDFVNFHLWPIFNIADSAIFIGILWLIVLEYKK